MLINASATDVWAAITNITLWPKYFTHVQSAKLNGNFEPGSVITWKSGGMTILSKIDRVEPFHSLQWTGKALGASAIHTWNLSSQGNQTLIKTTESFDGWLVKIMPTTFQRMLDKTLINWLLEIKQVAEKNSGG